MFSNLLIFTFLIGAAVSDQFSYDGYKVWSVLPKTKEQFLNLTQWQEKDGIDFWESPTMMMDKISIMTNPRIEEEFQKFLQDDNIDYQLLIDNVDRVLEEERINQSIGQKTLDAEEFGSNEDLRLRHFWSLNEINRYLAYLQTNYRNITQVEVVGRTHEGRPIHAVKISLRGRVDGSRPIIFIDAGVHAREWAAHMTAVYLLHDLIERSARHAEILNRVDFIIIPVVNPDGYEFTHRSQRLWRKNRRTFPNSRCVGVDGNRNYGFHWESSTNICGETYSGPTPFSEPEAQAVQRVLLQYRGRIRLYLSFHAFGNWVLYPYGYDKVRIANWREHEAVGNLYARAAFGVSRQVYTVGNSAILLYPAAGGSDDYAASTGVNLSYTLEVTRSSGFTLPANQIDRVGAESLAGVLAMARHVASRP